jgi:hypothetical protein
VTTRLGIVAGSGALPGQLIAGCRQAGIDVFVVAIAGVADPEAVQGVDHVWLDIAAIGQATASLRNAGCDSLCLIGGVERPTLGSLRPDWQGLALLPKLLGAASKGDDAILQVVLDHFEGAGFRIVGAEEVLAELAVPAGPLGRHRPDARDQAAIEIGIREILNLGRGTVAQAVVVRDGLVAALEAADGTDAMLIRCACEAGASPAGVLVKWPRPGQEFRIDLPTIGPATVAGAHRAGLKGIAVAAGGALVAERDLTIRRADEDGLFIVGIEAEVSR